MTSSSLFRNAGKQSLISSDVRTMRLWVFWCLGRDALGDDFWRKW